LSTITNQTRFLLDAWYHLVKDYGVSFAYVSVCDTAAINPETGQRDTRQDKKYCVNALPNSVSHDTKYVAKLLGRIESIETTFLCRVSDFPRGTVFKVGDHFYAAGIRYRNMNIEDYDGLLVHFTGEAVK
jgi:hypothetical protein